LWREINLIPKYLFEQIDGRNYSFERLYELAPLIFANDSNYLWTLISHHSHSSRTALQYSDVGDALKRPLELTRLRYPSVLPEMDAEKRIRYISSTTNERIAC